MKFVKMLIDRGHHAMLEHGGTLSVLFMVPRGITHEIVRHRIASFAQESTRYCDYYGREFEFQHTLEFGNPDGVAFIRPWYLGKGKAYDIWSRGAKESETAYLCLRSLGHKPEEARGALSIDLKAEIIMTANMREWRHFFSMRADEHAHPQARLVSCSLLRYLRRNIPVLFDDVGDPTADQSVSGLDSGSCFVIASTHEFGDIVDRPVNGIDWNTLKVSPEIHQVGQ
jgi:thymidylate synthase (FAD)